MANNLKIAEMALSKRLNRKDSTLAHVAATDSQLALAAYLARGEQQIEEGKVIPAARAFAKIRERYQRPISSASD